MALGNNYRGNDNNTEYNNPTVYCPIQFKNSNGVDPSTLSFSYWNKLLKISISPMIPAKPGDAYVSYDYKNNISIHINHMKARILIHELEEFLKDPNKLNSVGIASGTNSLLSVTNGKEYGVTNPVIVIRKVDENGAVTSSFAYEFNGPAYYNSVRNFDEKTLKFDTVDYPNAEILTFLDVLKSYVESANYAQAYTVVDAVDSVMRINTKLESLLDNAGISTGKGGSSKSNGRSFFQGYNNKPSTSRSQTTIEDLEDEL